MFLPISTDHHDGRIGIFSLVIIVVCLIVHVFVQPDSNRVEEELHTYVSTLYEDYYNYYADETITELLERHFELEDSLTTVAEASGKEYSNENVTSNNPQDVLLMQFGVNVPLFLAARDIAIKEILQTSVIHKHGLMKSRMSIGSLFSHMFLHADWWHLIGNLWFFYIVGIMMERYWGPIKFIISYLLIGIISGLGFMVISELQGANFESVPLVGASGAIAGMMGALFVTWRHIKVRLFYWYGFRMGTFEVTMGWYLGFYFAGQLFWGLWMGKYSAVAYMAHVSGFVVGMILGKLIPGDEIKPEELAHEGVFDASHIHIDPDEDEELQMRYGANETLAMTAAGIMSDPSKEADMKQRKIKKFPSEDAWIAFRNGKFADASDGLASAIDIYLRDVVRFGKHIEQDIERIYEVHKQLSIPVETYYQWAMQFEVNALKKSALFCYELCAQYATDDVDFRLRSLYKSAELRVEANFHVDRAKKVFEFIIANDQKGALRRQAEYSLEQLQH